MLKRGMTIEEATHEWVREMNRVSQDFLIRALEPDWDDFAEVTAPSVGDSVYIFDTPDDTTTHRGEIENITEDGDGVTYTVELDDGVLVDASLEDFEVERYSDMPMWGTMWQFGDSLDNYWLENEDGIRKMSECGFRIFKSEEFGYFFGIDGAGYSFYDEHWIPLYIARGLQWHDPATDGGRFAMSDGRMATLLTNVIKVLDAEHDNENIRRILQESGASAKEIEFLGLSCA